MGCKCSRAKATIDGGSVSTKLEDVHKDDIRQTYRLGPILGSGSFGQVRLCMHRQTEKQYACKIMTKSHHHSSRGPHNHHSGSIDFVGMFRNEIEILRSLKNPHIINIIGIFEDKHFLYAVMEKCEGGELFSKIVQKRRFTEREASRLCKDMLCAISYIHSYGIVHRDIKAENFLFSDKISNTGNPTCAVLPALSLSATALPEDFGRLVLIDFGMSVKLKDPTKRLRQVCGSPHYVAPELIRRSYRQEVDLWALGVIVFLMLYGRYPFEGPDQRHIAQKIVKNEPDYNRGTSRPSKAAIDFIKRLLVKDPSKRMTARMGRKADLSQRSIDPFTSAFTHKWMVVNQNQQAGEEEVERMPSPVPEGEEGNVPLTKDLTFVEEEERSSVLAAEDGYGEEEEEIEKVDSRAWDSSDD